MLSTTWTRLLVVIGLSLLMLTLLITCHVPQHAEAADIRSSLCPGIKSPIHLNTRWMGHLSTG